VLGVRIPPGLPLAPEGDMIGKLKVFLREAKAELLKVTWPDRKATSASTVVVLVVVVIVAFYLGLVDLLLNQLRDTVLSY
jgi:preprotein translocase subunit SecE